MAGRRTGNISFSYFGTGDGIRATNFNGPMIVGGYNGPTAMMLGGDNGSTMLPLRHPKRSSSPLARWWKKWSCTSSHLELDEPKKNMGSQGGVRATTKSTTTVSTQVTVKTE